jgi:hypothetical protein
MFSMDDFEKGNEYYENLSDSYKEMNDFVESLMLITHALKNIDYSETVKSGDVLMMKIFNMTNLKLEEENEKAFNVIMGLITHAVSTLFFMRNTEEYFDFFDQTIIYPMIGKD